MMELYAENRLNRLFPSENTNNYKPPLARGGLLYPVRVYYPILFRKKFKYFSTTIHLPCKIQFIIYVKGPLLLFNYIPPGETVRRGYYLPGFAKLIQIHAQIASCPKTAAVCYPTALNPYGALLYFFANLAIFV